MLIKGLVVGFLLVLVGLASLVWVAAHAPRAAITFCPGAAGLGEVCPKGGQ